MNRHDRRREPVLAKRESRQHYILVAAEIVFQGKPEEPLQAIRQNTLIISDDGRIGVLQMSRAQQAVQAAFLEKMTGVGTITVADVVILAMMPLGQFTAKEFHAQAPKAELEAQLADALVNE